MTTLFITLTIVFSVLMAAAGIARIIGIAVIRANAERLGVPYRWHRWIGAAEIVCAAALLIGLQVRPVGIAAAVLVVLESLGSVALHARIREGATKLAAYVPTIVASVALLVSAVQP